MRHPLRRSAALAAALTLSLASAAAAHPAFDPNRLPAGEAVDAVLVVPHGCDPDGGMPEGGDTSPTVAFDLELAPEVTSFEAHELEGWEVARDGDVVSWSATAGGTTEPIAFPVTLAVDGPPDDPIHLSAFQECEEGSFRWIGTPDRDAEFPAVRLIPTAGEIGTEAPEDDHVEGGAGDGHAEDDHSEDDHGEDDHGEDDHGEDDHAGEEPDSTVTEEPTGLAADEAAEPAASRDGWVVIAVVLLVLGAGAAILWARRRGAA